MQDINNRMNAIIMTLAAGMLLLAAGAYAGDGEFVWAKRMGGTSSDRGRAIALDSAGNVYTTGWFGGTVDFDPGPGTYNLTSAGVEDIFVSKLDVNGDFIWAKRMGGTSDDNGFGITVDSVGNVYTTGWFHNMVDFDPGSGTFNLTSAGAQDIFVSKLDANGDFVWAKRMGGTIYDEGYEIAVDSVGSVYTVGRFGGTSDFDPGPGTFNLTSAGIHDIFVSKLDANGDFVWAKRMGGAKSDYGGAIAVDGVGNVYTTGLFAYPSGGTADFDPGPGTFNLTSAGVEDIFVSKLDANGDFAWAKRMGGTSSDRGLDIAMDSAANVYTTGWFVGTADFDPGPGTFNLTSAGVEDIFVSKLDANGDFVWAKGTSSGNGDGIAVDSSGNVYTTGIFLGTVDFDPGPDTFNLTSTGGRDIFVSKLDANGDFIWARGIGGASSDDIGYGIAVDNAGDVHTTGQFDATADFDPGPGLFNLTSAGAADIFVSKLEPDVTLPNATAITPSISSPTNADTVDFAVTFDEGVQGFNDATDILIGHSGTANTGVIITGSDDTYTVSVSGITGDGSFTLAVSTSSDVQDLAGNALASSVTSAAVVIDNTPANATATTPATTGPTNATSVDFAVTFDEGVQGFNDAADVVISHSGTANTGVSITGSGDTYTVSVSGITGDGSFTLAVSTSSDVQDLAGNALASSVTSAAVTVDNTPPGISIGAPTGSPVNSGGTAAFPVTVSGADSINLLDGKVTLNHSGTAGGSVTILNGATATPSVQVTGVTGDGSYTISIASGVAGDTAGNTSLAVGPSTGAVMVDNTDPVFSNVVATPSEASAGETTRITFDSSEPTAGDPEVTVNGNPAMRTSKAAYAYEYTLDPSDPIGAASIDIGGVDAAGNAGMLTDSSALVIMAVPAATPLAPWPLALVLGAAATAVVRRRTRK